MLVTKSLSMSFSKEVYGTHLLLMFLYNSIFCFNLLLSFLSQIQYSSLVFPLDKV